MCRKENELLREDSSPNNRSENPYSRLCYRRSAYMPTLALSYAPSLSRFANTYQSIDSNTAAVPQSDSHLLSSPTAAPPRSAHAPQRRWEACQSPTPCSVIVQFFQFARGDKTVWTRCPSESARRRKLLYWRVRQGVTDYSESLCTLELELRRDDDTTRGCSAAANQQVVDLERMQVRANSMLDDTLRSGSRCSASAMAPSGVRRLQHHLWKEVLVTSIMAASCSQPRISSEALQGRYAN